MAFQKQNISLLDLPEDILQLIFPYLAPRSFLNLCSVNKKFYYQYHLDPLYWRVRTCNTFRIPISPLLHANGAHWHWLYKKLRTQTRPFTWGSGTTGGLGPSTGIRDVRNNFLPHGVFPRTESSWPTEVYVRNDVGTIADLQCGGWATVILTTDGKLFCVGVLDAKDGVNVGTPDEHFTRLALFGQHSVTGIRQFSTGRCHVLGLDDNGLVWSWNRSDQPGRKILFQNNWTMCTKVVAGWSYSSAFLPAKGIAYWRYVQSSHDPREDDFDPSVKDILVPATGYSKHFEEYITNYPLRPSTTDPGWTIAKTEVGEVLAHIVLENYIVFITSLSRAFACHISESENPLVFPLPAYSYTDAELKDIQGSFRNFAVFTARGEVLMGDSEHLDAVFHCYDTGVRGFQPTYPPNAPHPAAIYQRSIFRYPALQHTGVIALAFGDYHMHALHTNGTATAYGIEPRCCGALGLGSTSAGSRFRGLKTSRNFLERDGRLLPVANHRGRRVWFAREMRDWLGWMEGWIRTPTAHPHFPEVFGVLDDSVERQAAFSEWVEQEGMHWVEGPDGGNGADESVEKDERKGVDGFPAYFAISIAAAGWHSGALVLVDDEKAERTRQRWLVAPDSGEASNHEPASFEASVAKSAGKTKARDEYVWEKMPFPKVRLPDGYEFPGEGELRAWKDGMPSLEELGIIGDEEAPAT